MANVLSESNFVSDILRMALIETLSSIILSFFFLLTKMAKVK